MDPLSLARAAVGAVLIFSASTKMLDPQQAYRDLRDHLPLRLASPRLAITALVAFEGLVGSALVLGVYPELAVPLAAAFLLAATATSAWSIRSGSPADCGCYGGVVTLSTRASVALNVVYLAALACVWALSPPSAPHSPWAVGTAVVVGVGLGGAAWPAFLRPIVDMAPLRVGRRWAPRWLASAPDPLGPLALVLLRPTCPHCKVWVPFLNIFHAQTGTPGVLGVLSGTGADVAPFVAEHWVRFPVVPMDESVFDSLVPLSPMGVLVREGRIVEVWDDDLPGPLVSAAHEYYVGRYPAPPHSELAPPRVPTVPPGPHGPGRLGAYAPPSLVPFSGR